MKRYIIYFLNILLVSVFTSCDEVEELNKTFSEKKNHTLTLRLNTDGMQSRTINGEDSRNENLIQTLDCFFFTSESGNAVCRKTATIPTALTGTGEHLVNITFEEDELIPLFGSDYRDNGNGRKCFVYIIANLPASVAINSTETIQSLKSKTLTANFTTPANQANFVMDSGSPTEGGAYEYDEITLNIQDNTASLSGHVNLYRSAAEVGLFVRVPEQIINGTGDDETVWTPVSGSMTVKFHNGVNKANIDNTLSPYAIQTGDYFETAACQFQTLTTPITDNGISYSQTTAYPFYTYPTSTDVEHGTYFTLYLSWKSQTEGADTDNTEDDQYQYKNCTYQIPINKLEALKRNNYYRLLLNVGVLGTESDVVTLEPSYTILNWNDEPINTDIEENVYLVVNEHNVTINNKNSYAVEFVSSHPVQAQILSITQPYYASNIAGTTTFCNYEEGRGLARVESETTTGIVTIGTNTNAATQSLYRDCSVSVDNNTNTIVLNHDVVNMGADGAGINYDIAPYTIKVYVKMVYGTGANQYFEDTIEFIQYPAIYVEAQQNSDYGEGDDNNGDRNVLVNSYYEGYSIDHVSTIPNSYTDRSYDIFGNVPGLSKDADNQNPNMYVIHITSLSDNDNTIGDPRVIDNDQTFINSAKWAMAPAFNSTTPRKLTSYYPTNGNRTTNTTNKSKNASDYITGNVIAPIIRVASSYSVTSDTNSEELAQKRCASYQEDGYPAGRWRMPTYAEAAFIVRLSQNEKIPLLFNKSTRYWCAHGRFYTDGSQVYLNPDNNNTRSIRCVYDEWYWGSEQITNRSQFTWGDYPRDAWPPSGN